MMPVSYANPAVLEFYRSLPFNSHGSPLVTATEVRKQSSLEDLLQVYTPLRELLDANRIRILDLGSGVGWLANVLAYYYRKETVGVDFNPVAIDYSRKVADILGNSVTFVESDLFMYRPDDKFNLVISLGVLHHTDNCVQAIRHACRYLIKSDGHFFLGLYHAFGRKPFLNHFQELRMQGVSEEALYSEYRKLHTVHIPA